MAVLGLLELPVEVLVNIFSHLDEADFKSLEQTCTLFQQIVLDEELWKTLFLQRNNTLSFPSFSRSHLYSVEYVERNKGLNQWRHNRATKTKYTISHDPTQQHRDISKVVFDFPRCACYNEGLITFLQLHTKRKKDRVAYIQCTTPHGSSTMHFNINAVVFGRYDGRVFGKLLTNKSYLSPVTEFDEKHECTVTAISTVAYEDSSDDWCISGDESGTIIWWCNTKKKSTLKISSHSIAQFHVHRSITIAMDLESIYVIKNMNEVHSINLLDKIGKDFSEVRINKVDFGGKNIILATYFELYVISFDIGKDFGNFKVMRFDTVIQEVSLDEKTAKKSRDLDLPGDDGCFVSVLTEEMTVYVINIRSNKSELRYQTKLSFHESWMTCQVTNLVLVCAFSGMIGIYDAITGNEIRVIQNTETFPEFLNVSHGQILIGKGNVLNYYQYVSEDEYQKKKKGSMKSRSNKWNENLELQLAMYDEEKQSKKENENNFLKWKRKFVGDIDDEQLQLEIALLESQNYQNREQHIDSDTDEFISVANASTVSLDGSSKAHALQTDSDLDEDFMRALRESQSEDQTRRTRISMTRPGPLGELDYVRTSDPLSDAESLDEDTKRQIEIMESINPQANSSGDHNATEDEDLALAIALSLSQVNGTS